MIRDSASRGTLTPVTKKPRKRREKSTSKSRSYENNHPTLRDRCRGSLCVPGGERTHRDGAFAKKTRQRHAALQRDSSGGLRARSQYALSGSVPRSEER